MITLIEKLIKFIPLFLLLDHLLHLPLIHRDGGGCGSSGGSGDGSELSYRIIDDGENSSVVLVSQKRIERIKERMRRSPQRRRSRIVRKRRRRIPRWSRRRNEVQSTHGKRSFLDFDRCGRSESARRSMNTIRGGINDGILSVRLG